MNQLHFNVKQYGAVGDGTTKDTLAIQRTIDTCAEAGGGTVFVPAGRYLTGTIYLKSNVELHVASGSTIVASPDRADYNPSDVFPENEAFVSENVTATHLIIAYKQENVSITGSGTIDGSSSSFFGPLPDDLSASYRFKSGSYPIPEWRPGQMVFFCRCRRVTVRHASLVNAPYWTLFLLGCEQVQIHGITISNPPATRNGDGIDIDCCRNVIVSDCIIRGGDDCITLRANKRPLGEHAMPCENVTVTNCILSTPCNAIRIGVGDGEVRRASFSNIVVPEARTVISIVSRWSPQSGAHGALIEQIRFNDFIADAVMPIVVSAGSGAAAPAAIRGISFNRFRMTACAASQFVGTPDVPIRDIRLNDLELDIRGGSNNRAFAESFPEELSTIGHHGMHDEPTLPCALFGRHLEGAEFDRIRIRWESPGAVWDEGIRIEQADQVRLNGVRLRQPHETGAAIRCRSVNNIRLTDCQANDGTDIFLQTEASSPSASIRHAGNDLSCAKHPIVADIEDIAPL